MTIGYNPILAPVCEEARGRQERGLARRGLAGHGVGLAEALAVGGRGRGGAADAQQLEPGLGFGRIVGSETDAHRIC